MEIRKATRDDVQSIYENRLEFSRTIGHADITAEFKEKTYAYIIKHMEDNTLLARLAVDNGEIVSTAVLCIYDLLPTPSNYSGKTGCLLNVFTQEKYRRKGLATQVIKQLLADAKDVGVGKIVLTATTEGEYVYDKLGFEKLLHEMAFKL